MDRISTFRMKADQASGSSTGGKGREEPQMTFRRTFVALFVAIAALLAAAPALADDTCELPNDCVEYYEAYARGWVSGTSLNGGKARMYNDGPVDVCIDDFLFWTSLTTQTAFIDSTIVGQPEGVIPAGGHVTLYYGSWTTPNGYYRPYPNYPRWWCAENGQLFTTGGSYEWYGDTIPDPILDIVDDPDDSDGDGTPDTAEWWGAYGVLAQYDVWNYQEISSVFTVGKLAEEGTPGTVDVTLTVRNLGEVAGTATVTDTLPAGASASGYTIAPDSEVPNGDGTTTVTWSLSLAGFTDPANMSADTVYTAEVILYTMTVPADADHGRFELPVASVEYHDGFDWYTTDSQPALAFDLDVDGDGFSACDGDCDDNDDTVYPGATELCDGIDNDCDGEVDEGFDADGDGWTTCDGDCDDTDPSVNPGAWEGPLAAPYAAASWESTWQGLRNNGTPVLPLRSDPDTALTHEPADFEGGFYSLGFGGEITVVFEPAVTNGPGDDVLVWEKTYGPNSPYPVETADVFAWDAAGATWVLLGEASNEPSSARSNVDNSFDLGALTSTTKILIVDTTNPCLHNGQADGFDVNGVDALQDSDSTCDGIDNDCDGDIDEGFDADGDGWTTCGGDCDDNDAAVNPDATEVCNGIDDDCDGLLSPLELDDDGDGMAECDGDCDDTDDTIYDGAPELCDGIDNDCDGVVPGDELDDDGDGLAECEGDCDDADANNYPGNTEVCDGQDNDCDGSVDEGFDLDGDGFTSCGGDCDDGAADVFPGAPELCDGIDNDCDGLVPATELDDDGDGLAECQGDCDDADAANFPGNTEVCDGQDNDCDALVDEGYDVDGDGFTSCAGDCDDGDASVFPGATEVCNGIDDDCDGDVDEGFDVDGDGWTGCGGDCNDADADTYPGATELCDGADNDCDGAVPMDELDLDSDGWAECEGDCEPWDGDINPDAFEECDGIDNDCDGDIDEGYDDLNGNGIADCNETCNDGEAVFVSAGDGTTQVLTPTPGDAVLTWDQNSRWTADIPGAEWIWDMWLEDTPKTGAIVELQRVITLPDYATVTGAFLVMSADNSYEIEVDGFPAGGSPIETNYFGEQYYDLTALFGPGDNTLYWEVDNWAQSWGNAYTNPGGLLYELTVTWEGTPIGPEICDGIDNDCDGVIPADEVDADGDGFMVCDGDCDDGNADIYPGATEECDGLDNDCDGVVPADETDADGDGFMVCEGDCDDGDASAYPGATEVCDGIDNDCDGLVDEGFDSDGDGWTTCGGDCDDGNADIYPGATEECNGVDDDCDGVVPAGEVDLDGDGFMVCEGDCDDGDASTFPGATELCDGLDNDCDGVVPADEADLDGDGFAVCEGDCNDAEPAMFPGNAEICDGLDNDCDGVIPDSEYDFDGDGVAWCDDCNDGDPTIYPGAPEYCDNIDTDCDGAADNGFDDDGDGIPDCIDECPMVIDIDTDPWDEGIAAGDDVEYAYMNWGVTIETYTDPSMTVADPSLAWDSGAPTVGDEDKGTPNQDFGGPGIGFGGEAGMPGENAVALHNLMKGDEDTNTWWLLNFTSSTCVHSIDFIDVDTDELPAQVILFDVNVQTIATIDSLPMGDNSVQTLDLGGICGVYVMMIDFYGGGGWDNLVVCVDPSGGPEVCDDGIDNDGDGFIDEDCEPPPGDDDDDDDDDAADDDDDDDCDDDWDWDCDSSFTGRNPAPLAGLALVIGLLGLARRRS